MAVLEALELTQADAKKVVKKAIKYGAYAGDMPTDKKGQLNAANDVAAFCIDAVVNDKIREEEDDEEIIDAAKKVDELLEMLGIDIDDEYNVTVGEEDDDEDEEDEEDEDDDSEDDEDEEDEDDEDEDEDDDDESPFDPDDFIEGYTDLSAAGKVKALKKLDFDDEDNLAAIENLKEWEEEQDKPSSRVLSWIEETFDFDDEDEEDDDDEDDDDSEDTEDDDSDDDDDEDDEDEDESEDSEEPWEGYDKATAKVICDRLKDEDELTVEQAEYVKEYEEAMERPRKRVITLCEKLIEELKNEDSDDDDEEEKPKPKKGRSSSKGKKSEADPDESDDADDAVARDDEKESRSKGKLVLTRDQIIEALTSGKVTIKL